ncbi:MAG: DNA-binding response regulator [Chloroflexi bacterium]|nr:MAG: DNA-binding response regulator [Chloroflexota bacterium]
MTDWYTTFFGVTSVSSAKILVIDDEQSIINLVSAYLQKEGYTVFTATDGPAGLQAARTLKPDLIVLDIMLPGMDGIELLTQLRRDSQVYVLMLTAKSEETDKIIGLSVGADDYLTKPFSPRELVARIKAALRRYGQPGSAPASRVLNFGRLRIDPEARLVWKDDVPVELTAIEFDLLHALAEHRGRVLSREQLLERVWGHDFYGEARVVDVHLGHIRKKVEDNPARPELLVTVRGVGYRFEDAPQ